MKVTECDKHLINLVAKWLNKVPVLLIPGATLATFAINIALPSAAGVAAAVGAILIPLLMSAGVHPATAAAAVKSGTYGSMLSPGLAHNTFVAKLAAAFGPFMLAIVAGSGDAAAFAFNEAVTPHAKEFGLEIINMGSMASLGGALGRTMFPITGATSEINEYMYNEAVRIVKAAADMYGVTVELVQMGGAVGCGNDAQLVETLHEVAVSSGLFDQVLPSVNIGGSEDCTYFMERVQQKGGQVAYLMIGTDLMAGHHDSHFDFDEETLVMATAFLGEIAVNLLNKQAGI